VRERERERNRILVEKDRVYDSKFQYFPIFLLILLVDDVCVVVDVEREERERERKKKHHHHYLCMNLTYLYIYIIIMIQKYENILFSFFSLTHSIRAGCVCGVVEDLINFFYTSMSMGVRSSDRR